MTAINTKYPDRDLRSNGALRIFYGILLINMIWISETDDLTATIILDTPTDDYEEVKTHLSNVRRILEFFILSTRNIEVDYLVRGETDFILGENRLGYNMNL